MRSEIRSPPESGDDLEEKNGEYYGPYCCTFNDIVNWRSPLAAPLGVHTK